MAKQVVPKGCVVHRVSLESSGAEVGFRCDDATMRALSTDGSGQRFALARGDGFGTYPSRWLRGVKSVRLNGATISGDSARVGFELSPRSATCKKDRTELDCKVK